MPELVLHELTRKKLDAFINHPSHALLLVGAAGFGKYTLSLYLASQLTGKNEVHITQSPYVRIIAPEKQSIPIESIRDLREFTKLKLPTSERFRLIIIDNAQYLTHEAQNAVLKMLEEPPQRTVFILNIISIQSVLPTISSRAQSISLQKPSQTDLESHFKSLNYDEPKIRQAYLMSGGLPGLMDALLKDDTNHPLVVAANTAREFIKSDSFNRLIIAETLSKDRDSAISACAIMQQMANVAIQQAATRSALPVMRSWENILHRAYNAENELINSAQTKLVMTNLALNV